MSAHSRYSPSSAHRWIACPGSVALIESLGLVDVPPGEYADEGTAAHTLAAECLTEGKAVWTQIGRKIRVPGPDGLTFRDFIVDKEMAEAVQAYVDAVCREGGERIIEHHVDLSAVLGLPEQGGTADAVVINGSQLGVHDLKFGRGVQVFAEQNPQLMLYALGVLEELDEMLGPFETLKLGIHQPRLDHLDYWDVSAAELRAFGDTAREAVRDAEAGRRRPLILDPQQRAELHPGDTQCQWCPAKARCPALERHVAETCFDDLSEYKMVAWDTRGPLGDAVFNRNAVPPPEITTKPTPDTADGAALALARARVPLIEAWCAAVCAETDTRLATGLPVPGWKLVEGRRGPRKWRDEEAAEMILRDSFRMKRDDMYKSTLISPTEAEKKLTEQRYDKLRPLVMQSDGKPQAVPESDKRPAVIGAATFDILEHEA